MILLKQTRINVPNSYNCNNPELYKSMLSVTLTTTPSKKEKEKDIFECHIWMSHWCKVNRIKQLTWKIALDFFFAMNNPWAFWNVESRTRVPSDVVGCQKQTLECNAPDFGLFNPFCVFQLCFNSFSEGILRCIPKQFIKTFNAQNSIVIDLKEIFWSVEMLEKLSESEGSFDCEIIDNVFNYDVFEFVCKMLYDASLSLRPRR